VSFYNFTKSNAMEGEKIATFEVVHEEHSSFTFKVTRQAQLKGPNVTGTSKSIAAIER
jgi:hypothetical protein